MTTVARRLNQMVEDGYIDQRRVAWVLEKSTKSVRRWLRDEAEPRWETRQRMLELEAVLDRLRGVVEPDAAEEWLFKPVPILDYRQPAELLRRGEFRDVLGAIDAMSEGAFV
jgi:uncharacterized protein (DUF2384 family)